MEPTAFEAAALHAAAVVHSGLAVTTRQWRSAADETEQLMLEDLERIATELLGLWIDVVDEAYDLVPIEPAASMQELAERVQHAEAELSEVTDTEIEDGEPETMKYLAGLRHYAARLERYAGQQP